MYDVDKKQLLPTKSLGVSRQSYSFRTRYALSDGSALAVQITMPFKRFQRHRLLGILHVEQGPCWGMYTYPAV